MGCLTFVNPNIKATAMSSYLARIELHNANGSDYIDLHERMKAQGYTRTIRSVEGVLYQLPTAEYQLTGAFLGAEALRRAREAAAGTGKSFGAIVVESSDAHWYGLPFA
jgi:hypothetical protein